VPPNNIWTTLDPGTGKQGIHGSSKEKIAEMEEIIERSKKKCKIDITLFSIPHIMA
jgi:pentose-5-phosphate-3-epimerase